MRGIFRDEGQGLVANDERQVKGTRRCASVTRDCPERDFQVVKRPTLKIQRGPFYSLLAIGLSPLFGDDQLLFHNPEIILAGYDVTA